MTHIEAMKQALEALKTAQNNLAPSKSSAHSFGDGELWDFYEDAATSLRQAIATEESSATQEPVAWMHSKTCCLYETFEEVPLADADEWPEPLYTHPQPKAEQDLDAICQDLQEKTYTQAMRIADLEKDLSAAYIRGHEDGMKAKAEQDQQLDQLIQERDHAHEIIDKLCDAVLGSDRYEWSSMYFFEDAVNDVEEKMASLEEQEPKREWVGLTLEDKQEYTNQDFGGNRLDAMDWAEKRLKEKNT